MTIIGLTVNYKLFELIFLPKLFCDEIEFLRNSISNLK
jgi:hypothetical protein